MLDVEVILIMKDCDLLIARFWFRILVVAGWRDGYGG